MAEANLLGNCMILQDDSAGTKLEPMHASMQDLKNGKWFTSQNHGLPGTISSVKMSKTGKHGHAKFTFQVKYPFSDQNSQEMHPGHTHLTRPIMVKREWMVTSYDPDDGNLEMMDEQYEPCHGYVKPDYVQSDGYEFGKKFAAAWKEADDGGKEMLVNILEGPVKAKTNYIVRQVEGWKIKDAET